jgi:hypothetical protein
LDELKQIRESGPAVILDLEEVTLVDVENEAAQSIKLVHFQSTFLR